MLRMSLALYCDERLPLPAVDTCFRQVTREQLAVGRSDPLRPKPDEGHEAEESAGLNTGSGLSLEGFAKRRSDRSLTNPTGPPLGLRQRGNRPAPPANSRPTNGQSS
jgi:hypothetical protein